VEKGGCVLERSLTKYMEENKIKGGSQSHELGGVKWGGGDGKPREKKKKKKRRSTAGKP